ncbi:MAG: DMT family transporter [Rhodospirillales bacterium]|nr:DMT family transporter [Rhodospirillales bacterium]MSP79980.1 DMT family transporter [Rhodospirillales bacterium]
MSEASDARTLSLWFRLAPALFVVMWSTGFIFTKLGLPHAEPLTFLFARFGITTILFTLTAFVFRARWPATWREAGHIAVAGAFVQGIYLGGVFWAISRGLGAGVVALIMGLQPLLTAAAAGVVLGEKVTVRQWIGLAVGFAGVVLVVADRDTTGRDDWAAIAATAVAIAGLTIGVLYQKRHATGMDLRSGLAIQFAVSTLLVGAGAILTEDLRIEWTGTFIVAMTWLVLVLSVGNAAIFYRLIRQGAAAKVSSLFYLVPPVTAIMTYFLFDERLGPWALAGMAAVVLGVAMATRK